jgi:hypothetical protein
MDHAVAATPVTADMRDFVFTHLASKVKMTLCWKPMAVI